MKPYDEEEEYHKKEKQEFRKERKILSKKDRSKFKKTDQDKLRKEVPKGENLRRGRVLAIMADGILVDFEDQLYTCLLRGALKKENLRIKNLVAVGDFVLFEPRQDFTGSIAHVDERHSILSRAEQTPRQKQQLIAVNVDQVLITASVVIPPLKPPLIDRYIIAALKGNLDPVIVINKIDLLKDHPEEKALFKEVKKVYTKLNIPVIAISAKTGKGLAALKKAMQGKSSVFSGQSGTGKSSLINTLTGTSLLTGQVISKTKKGAHTTTSTQMLPIEGEGFCVDTPGIKSFGMWDLEPRDVQHYFHEFEAISQGCRFPNCAHMHEPECAVRESVEQGEISRLRFDSYCALITDLKEKPKR